MTKDESDIPKSNEIKPKKQKKKANKAGPKETWCQNQLDLILMCAGKHEESFVLG